jgi:hypothetical protein
VATDSMKSSGLCHSSNWLSLDISDQEQSLLESYSESEDSKYDYLLIHILMSQVIFDVGGGGGTRKVY